MQYYMDILSCAGFDLLVYQESRKSGIIYKLVFMLLFQNLTGFRNLSGFCKMDSFFLA